METLIASQEGGSVANRFLDWLKGHPSRLQQHLTGVVPASTAAELDLAGWTWVDRLSDPDDEGIGGWFSAATADLGDDLDGLSELEKLASSEGKHKWAHSLQRTRKTLAERRVLDFLAQRGVLPKYGFPVDVVELDLSRSQEATAAVELSRDLKMAVLEFAPGARVVAASHLWVSKGIRHTPGKDLPVHAWGICDGCGVLRSQTISADTDRNAVLNQPCTHCGSEMFASGQRGTYVIPIFGFVGDRDPREPGETRPPREGYLQTYFAEYRGAPPRARDDRARRRAHHRPGEQARLGHRVQPGPVGTRILVLRLVRVRERRTAGPAQEGEAAVSPPAEQRQAGMHRLD